MILPFVICIPSYHRSDTIKKNTLATLDRCGVPHDLIKVFVSAPEVAEYRKSLPDDIEVIESVLGCTQNRTYISNYYQEGQHIVYIDDDIKDILSVCDLSGHTSCHIYRKENVGQPFYKKQIPIPNLMRFLVEAFDILHKEGARLGGIYPVANGFFGSHKYTTGLRYITGAFYLNINTPAFEYLGDQFSEDFERTCYFYRLDGKVVRFEYVLLNTAYYKGAGGLVETRTTLKTKASHEQLLSRYPDYLKLLPPTKSTPYWNLKCKKLTAQSVELK